ncbi:MULTISPECIES: ferredoxin [unclassified Polymorphospora]
MAKVTVDVDGCIGAGQCAFLAPEVFDQDQMGIVRLLREEPDGSQLDDAREAATTCPSGSISISDD